MHLSTYMHTPPVTCELNATLAEVARMMEFDEVGSVVVMTDDNDIAGIVTDRDLAVRGLAHEGGPLTLVETIMSTPVITSRECHGALAGRRVARRHHAAVHEERETARPRCGSTVGDNRARIVANRRDARRERRVPGVFDAWSCGSAMLSGW